MTDITELKQAVCAAIFESCGVLTLPDSGKSGKSPFFAVKASEGEGVVMDGGRQIERKVRCPALQMTTTAPPPVRWETR